MTEYIEREAAIKIIKDDAPELVYYTKQDAIDCIKCARAADVAPVLHAKIIPESVLYNEHYGECGDCSNCGSSVWLDSNYCPHCGAKLDLQTPQERIKANFDEITSHMAIVPIPVVGKVDAVFEMKEKGNYEGENAT